MAKYQIIAALITPDNPKAVADFNTLESAWEKQDIETMYNILTDYDFLNGAIEEYDSDSDYGIEADDDGFYLLKKITELAR